MGTVLLKTLKTLEFISTFLYSSLDRFCSHEPHSMATSTFAHAILRMTVLQILRAMGFDRASPQVIDIVTDLYIRHLALLTSECINLSQARGNDGIELQDITQGLVNLGMLKPSAALDIFEQEETSNGKDGKDVGAEQFFKWCTGELPQDRPGRARIVSRVTSDMKQDDKSKVGRSLIPEYLGVKTEQNGEEGSQREQQGKEEDTNVEGDEDWLTFLMKKSTRLGTDDKFRHTVLGGIDARSDYRVVGPETEVEGKLPYNAELVELDELDDLYE